MKLIVRNLVKSLLAVCMLSQVHCASIDRKVEAHRLKHSDRVCNAMFNKANIKTINTPAEKLQYQECLQKNWIRQELYTNIAAVALGHAIAVWVFIFGDKIVKKIKD